MAYDFDFNHGRDRDQDHSQGHSQNHNATAHLPAIKTAGSRDLETIVCLLEMAAISLTTVSKHTFTREELLREARVYGGSEIVLDDKDVDLVIGKAGFLKKEKQQLRLR